MKRLLTAFFLVFLFFTAHAQNVVLPDFTQLIAKEGAAVVNISTTQLVRSNASGFPLDEDDPMFEFFRRFMPRQPGLPGMPRESERHSLGSGFIISADGYILTNAHVIDSADEVAVRLIDKREFKAKVIGADRRTDVALIKIEASSLPVVRMGNPEALKVGEWVVAIGSPFGFDNTVTAGIVSAKGRSLPQESYVPFIQTDVAVNPGNSGGPLFNMAGEVVGINSQIYSRSGGFMGISFAIPIDVAMSIQKQLRANGKVSRGRIGVAIQDLSKELAESFGLDKAQGALISAVEKGGAAEKAGIEPGDIILKFDDKLIAGADDLPRIVGATQPGTNVKIQIWRKGANKNINVVVEQMPDDEPAGPTGKTKKTPSQSANRLGLALTELNKAQLKELGINHGLLIEEVRGNTARADLRPGDIILALLSQGETIAVTGVQQFNGLLAKFDKKANITLLVKRGEGQIFVTIKASSAEGK